MLTVKQLKGILESISDDARVVVHTKDNDQLVAYGVGSTKAQFGFFILEADDTSEEVG